uniref:zinc-ribbon domain-containing protein n=1 Tax=Aquabacterium sp. TaxID=1872578 RepID=UPI0027BAA2C9
MSLATRCIHCGTIFKIVEDQLKVSEGWVRCGRCHEVFNALPTLFDMDSEAPPPRRAPDAALLREPVTEAFTPPAPDPQIEDELPPEPARPVRGT